MASNAALFDDAFIPVQGRSAIPLADIAPWAVLGMLLALIFLYFVSTEQGAYALFKGMYVHEFVHDGRHLLGFPATDRRDMTKDLLWRGMLAGILAALLSTLFARAFAEPQIDLAIGYEESHAAHAAHHMSEPAGDSEEEELVSRDTQKSAGLLTALALYGAAVGGVFSLVFAYGYGRFGMIGPRSLSLLLAGLAFLLIVIVPALKYPQTPPAVGKHETVGLRTAAYFAMIALSLGAAVVAGKARATFARGRRGFDATLFATGLYIAIVALGQLLLPPINEVPGDFPATLLWNFRIASIATQLLMWATIGIAFGAWAERVLRRERAA